MEIDNCKKEHILTLFRFVKILFSDKVFTLKEFYDKRRTTSNIAANELLYLQKLGILEYFSEGSSTYFRLRKVFKDQVDNLASDIQEILSGLYIEPNDDELIKVGGEIDRRILKEGIKKIAEAVRNSFFSQKYKEIIEEIITYWPCKSLSIREKKEIENSLSEKEIDYFNRNLKLFHRRKLNDNKLFIGDLIEKTVVSDKGVFDKNENETFKKIGFIRPKRATTEVVKIIYVMKNLLNDYPEICGIFLGNWNLYIEKFKTLEEVEQSPKQYLNIVTKKFFELFSQDIKEKLIREYNQVLNHGDKAFLYFIAALWSDEDCEWSDQHQKCLKTIDAVKKCIKELIKEGMLIGENIWVRIYNYMNNGRFQLAINLLKKIIDTNEYGHREAVDIIAKIEGLISAEKRITVAQTIFLCHSYFKQGKSIREIKSATKLSEKRIRNLLSRFDNKFYEVLPDSIRSRLLRDEIEKLYLLARDSSGFILREAEWLEKANFPDITHRQLRDLFVNTHTLKLENSGFVGLPEKFLTKIGNINDVILIEIPDSKQIELRPQPKIFPNNGLYDVNEIQ